MNHAIRSCATMVAISLLAGLASAADQTIVGRSLIVRNPSTPEKRRIGSVGREVASPNTIVGDPTANGGALTVIANGANPTSQTFDLPQGSTIGGKAFWRTAGLGGYRYKDGRGEQGPVRTVIIRKTPRGVFNMKVLVRGKNGTVDVVPPDPGTDGFVTLTLGGGDRYCMQFGADGVVINRSDRLFKVRRPVIEGCPGGASTTTTTTSTTTTTLYSSPSRAFLDVPRDLLD